MIYLRYGLFKDIAEANTAHRTGQSTDQTSSTQKPFT